LLHRQHACSAQLTDAEECHSAVRGVVAFVHARWEIAMIAISSCLKAIGEATYVERSGKIVDIEERREVGGKVVTATVVPVGRVRRRARVGRCRHESVVVDSNWGRSWRRQGGQLGRGRRWACEGAATERKKAEEELGPAVLMTGG
jgi:hypothetical protein